MSYSEKNNHKIAIVISAICHAILLIIPTCRHVIVTQSTPKAYEIPVKFSIETVIQKEATTEETGTIQDPEPPLKAEVKATTIAPFEKAETGTSAAAKPKANSIQTPGDAKGKETTKPGAISKSPGSPDGQNTARPGSASQLPGSPDGTGTYSSISLVTPKIAITNEWKGTIIVNATIGADGTVTEYEIIKSTGFKELDAVFIKTIIEGELKKKGALMQYANGKIRLEHEFK